MTLFFLALQCTKKRLDKINYANLQHPYAEIIGQKDFELWFVHSQDISVKSSIENVWRSSKMDHF